MATPPYKGILFSFADMLREIENMRHCARKFIKRTSFEQIIPEWKRQLETLKGKSPGSKIKWQIPSQTPIETVPSQGKYEPAGKKGKNVTGTLSCIWEIEIPPSDKKNLGKHFLLNGLASIETILFVEYEDLNDIFETKWKLETGDINSPGCHFHTQIPFGEIKCKSPKPISVPRLPAFLHTPMDALEFLISELFQEDWRRAAVQENEYQKVWSGCQRSRLIKMLDWQKEQINKSSGSPWTHLKNQKPVQNIFLN